MNASHPDATEHRLNLPVAARRAPGQVVWAHEVRARGVGHVRMWQIHYTSTSCWGQPIVVSGALYAPNRSRPGHTPVVGYAGASHGLGGMWAPSELLRRGMDPEARWIAQALDCGFAVAVADGLPPDGPHSFTAGRTAGYSVLDAIRAARQMPEVGSPNSTAVLWGYGSGGRAAVWAAELAPTYASDLDLRGVVAGGVPADLTPVIKRLDPGPLAAFGFAALLGLSTAHPHLHLKDEVLNNHGREVAPHAHGLGVAELLAEYDTPVGTWCTRPDPWEHPLLRSVLEFERAGRYAPLIPAHLYHGTADEIVPVDVGRDLTIDYSVLDVEITWREWPDTDHLRTGQAAADYAVSRLTECLSSAESTANRQTAYSARALP